MLTLPQLCRIYIYDMLHVTEINSYLDRVTDEGIIDGLVWWMFARQPEVVLRVEPDLEVGPEHHGQAGQAHQGQRHRRHHTHHDGQAGAGVSDIN